MAAKMPTFCLLNGDVVCTCS